MTDPMTDSTKALQSAYDRAIDAMEATLFPAAAHVVHAMPPPLRVAIALTILGQIGQGMREEIAKQLRIPTDRVHEINPYLARVLTGFLNEDQDALMVTSVELAETFGETPTGPGADHGRSLRKGSIN